MARLGFPSSIGIFLRVFFIDSHCLLQVEGSWWRCSSLPVMVAKWRFIGTPTKNVIILEVTIAGNLEDHPRTCKWLVAHIYKPWKGHLEGEQPYLGDLLTMVINPLQTGMILQEGRQPNGYPKWLILWWKICIHQPTHLCQILDDPFDDPEGCLFAAGGKGRCGDMEITENVLKRSQIFLQGKVPKCFFLLSI